MKLQLRQVVQCQQGYRLQALVLLLVLVCSEILLVLLCYRTLLVLLHVLQP